MLPPPGLIRTPLPPITTFQDDPLRVLRAVRFASRLNYELHADIVAAVLREPVIRDAFLSKVGAE